MHIVRFVKVQKRRRRKEDDHEWLKRTAPSYIASRYETLPGFEEATYTK
jgi:hypothetical protein